MITYPLDPLSVVPLYEQLVDALRSDILSGVLSPGSRLPSKRSFAGNLGISTITVEAAYNRLIDEGYVHSEPRRGYFIAEFVPRPAEPVRSADGAVVSGIRLPEQTAAVPLDLSGNRTLSERFPFSVWSRLLRETINREGERLLSPSPCGGILPLREAIAVHLQSFRGMRVDPDQIIIGAGTEYLYSLLIQLLGRDRVFCLEDPGYRKIAQVYSSCGVSCRWAPLDSSGLSLSGLEEAGADVVHISPTHHFPTGITMPVSRRYELLAWAGAKDGRFIIEDDYDSEFRLTGRPIPSLQSIDTGGKVIYMNTFSKTLAATIRISYMVLPPGLANRYYKNLSFYSCTVSSFDQYTLARFLSDGYFEKHLNRMRLYYARLRKDLLRVIHDCPINSRIRVLERDSGLHFLLELDTRVPDRELRENLLSRGVSFVPLSAYYLMPESAPPHTFLLNYSALLAEELEQALRILADVIGPDAHAAKGDSE